MMTVTKTFRLPLELAEKLDAQARIEGRSLNALVTDLLTRQSQDAAISPDALQEMQRLAGVRSGPAQEVVVRIVVEHGEKT